MMLKWKIFGKNSRNIVSFIVTTKNTGNAQRAQLHFCELSENLSELCGKKDYLTFL